MKQNTLFHIIIAYLAFIVLGSVDGLIGVAWPSIRADFGLPVDALGLLLLFGTIGFVCASFGNGRLLAWRGLAILLILGGLLRGLGALTQLSTASWTLFLVAGGVMGLGGGLLDANMNTYAATHFRARLLNWLHASFGVGTTVGSLLMTLLLSVQLGWRTGIALIASAYLVIALIFYLSRSRWELHPADVAPREQMATPIRATLRNRLTWLSIGVFFLYSGIEVGFGHWAFTLLTESRGVAATTAGFAATFYWGSFTIGRILLGFIESNLSRLVRWSMIITALGGIGFALNLNQTLSIASLMLIGFAQAPIFPALIALTPQRFGAHHAANAIGMQVGSAGVGVAIVPAIAGFLGDAWGLETIVIVLLLAVAAMLTLYEATCRLDDQAI